MLKPRSEIENRAATRREALPNFCGKTATIILADKKITGSFAILDWLERLFSCRKRKIRQFLVLPLTIPVYCLRATPRHVTEFVRGHVYWPSSVNSRACANIASFPGHVVKFEKSGLVSTVCACAAPQVFLGNLETSGYYAAISLRLSSYYRSLHAYN